jgi:hypothetical protein
MQIMQVALVEAPEARVSQPVKPQYHQEEEMVEQEEHLQLLDLLYYMREEEPAEDVASRLASQAV